MRRPGYVTQACRKYTTLLELAVLGTNLTQANEWLGKALAAVREAWEPETTARNLSLILNARHGRGEDVDWLKEIIAELVRVV
jgi:hypothetical protein